MESTEALASAGGRTLLRRCDCRGRACHARQRTEGAHQRYLNIFKVMERRDREMARLFNGLKRSEGLMMLARIRSAGLLTEDEFSNLSSETRGVIQMLLDRD